MLYRQQAPPQPDYEFSPCGVHWDALDEDISIEGLLAGRGDMTHRRQDVA
ncbi:DUF2442 domain-containing protein [Halomonas sp.]